MRTSGVYILVVTLLVGVYTRLDAQPDNVLFENAKDIDEDRYEDIKGSPFFFDDWVTGKILRNDGNIYEDVQLNYNGHTKEFEVYAGEGKMVELNTRDYLRIQVDRADNGHLADDIKLESCIFQRNIAPRFADQFIVLLYSGEGIFLFKEMQVRLARHTVQDVGRTVHFDKFDVNYVYYIKQAGKVSQLRLKKKALIDRFKGVDMTTYFKNERVDFNSDRDLVKMVEHYEQALQ